MTRWGIGPRFAAISLFYGAAAGALNYTDFPDLKFEIFNRSVNLLVGGLLVAVGLTIFIVPAFTIDRYIKQGMLCTKGVYAYLRHPIYGAWISFIVPGIVVMAGSVVLLTMPPFMYLVFRRLVQAEEEYLIARFGREYHDYRKRTWAVFPRLFQRGHWRTGPLATK